MGWGVRLEPLDDPIENRKKNIESPCVSRVMEHVVACRGTQPLRQPATHVRAPVNFFKSNIINREAGKHSRGPTIPEDPLQNQKWRCVGEEERHNSPRVAGKIDIPGRFRRIQRGVMDHVLLAEEAMPRMQDKPVQAILKPVGVEETQEEAAEDAEGRMRKGLEGDPNQNRSGQDRSYQVVPFDPQPLGFAIGPNYIIRNHDKHKLTLSLDYRNYTRNRKSGAWHLSAYNLKAFPGEFESGWRQAGLPTELRP